MIKTDTITDYSGASAPVSQIVTYDQDLGKFLLPDGSELQIGTGDGGGTDPGGGGTDPDPGGTTLVGDESVTLLKAAWTGAPGGVVQTDQESGQDNWKQYQLSSVQEAWTPDNVAGTFNLKKIDFRILSAGYQMIKIILFDENGQPISMTPSGANKLSLTDGSTVDLIHSGMMLVTNDSYLITNILDSTRTPVAGSSGWFALTSNADTSPTVQMTFSSVQKVSAARIYRCGGPSSFNGGTSHYEVEFIDDGNNGVVQEVPKLSDSDFASIDNFVNWAPTPSEGEGLDTSKVHTFNIMVSSDGNIYTPLVEKSTENVENNGSYNTTKVYEPKPTDTRRLYLKVEEADLAFLKSLKIDLWTASP